MHEEPFWVKNELPVDFAVQEEKLEVADRYKVSHREMKASKKVNIALNINHLKNNLIKKLTHARRCSLGCRQPIFTEL